MTYLRRLLFFAEVKYRGIKVDAEKIPSAIKDIVAKRDDVYDSMREHVNFRQWKEHMRREGDEGNLNSPDQKRVLIYDYMGLPFEQSTKSGEPSTSSKWLRRKENEHPLVPKLIEWSRLEQIRKNFLTPLREHVVAKEDGTFAVHPWWNVGGAKTSRISASDPSAQNQPDEETVRRLFLARGTFVYCDYSQIELRVLASVAGEQSMIKTFREGGDPHLNTAALIYDVHPDDVTKQMRSRAKNVNFGTVYGISPYGMESQFGIPVQEATHLLERFWKTMPSIANYIREQHEHATTHGFVVSKMGYVRNLPDAQLEGDGKDVRKRRSRALRQAGNFAIQGDAANITLDAGVELAEAHKEHTIEGGIVFNVHDAIISDIIQPSQVNFAMELQVETMTRQADKHPWLLVPLEVDEEAGKNYYDLENFKDYASEETPTP